MAYTRGDSKNIIVGAAALFIGEDAIDTPNGTAMPDFAAESYKDTLEGDAGWTNVGYTQNGMELTITPDFGEVEVDQLLDSAKIFKQGMQVTMNTTFAEATLENLMFAIAAPEKDLNGGLSGAYSGIRPTDAPSGTGLDQDTEPSSADDTISNPAVAGVPYEHGTGLAGTGANSLDILELNSGELGECPLERALCAVGPGTGDCAAGDEIERIYVAFRALSMDAVTVSVSRDSASTFDASFRLLPANNGSYGRIIDRTYSATGVPA